MSLLTADYFLFGSLPVQHISHRDVPGFLVLRYDKATGAQVKDFKYMVESRGNTISASRDKFITKIEFLRAKYNRHQVSGRLGELYDAVLEMNNRAVAENHPLTPVQWGQIRQLQHESYELFEATIGKRYGCDVDAFFREKRP